MYRPTQLLVQRSVSNPIRSLIQRRRYTNGSECKINLEETTQETTEKLTKKDLLRVLSHAFDMAKVKIRDPRPPFVHLYTKK